MVFAFAITTAGATILAAVILGVLGVIASIIQQRKLGSKMSEVHDALKTNHGKRPGEYLEMVGELAAKIERVEKVVTTVAITIADHTIADEFNFTEIRGAQDAIEHKLGANAEAAVAAVNAAVRANVAAKGYHDQVMAEIQATKEALCPPPRAIESRERSDDPTE